MFTSPDRILPSSSVVFMCAALGNAATHKTVKRATRRTNEIVM
jgi:hypothetical protein